MRSFSSRYNQLQCDEKFNFILHSHLSFSPYSINQLEFFIESFNSFISKIGNQISDCRFNFMSSVSSYQALCIPIKKK